MATVLPGREFEVFCEDSDFVLSRLNHQGDRPRRGGSGLLPRASTWRR